MAVVVTVGSVNVDLVVTVDRLPRPGETVAGGEFGVHHGGKGGNQAVAAARAGATVLMVAAIGDDANGASARAALEAEGVDTRFLAVAGAPTGVALIVVDRGGANQIAVASGANHLLECVPPLPDGDGVVLLSFEVPDPVITAAVEAARESRWRLVVNPAPARPLPPALHGSGAILVPNEGEAEVLAADPAALAALTGGPVVVTLGAAGARVIDGERAYTVPAPRVEAVDTTGAGDTLTGVLAASIAAGLAFEAAVRRAVAAASLSVTVPGARGGMPRSAEIDRLAMP
jgi:ribokinase